MKTIRLAVSIALTVSFALAGDETMTGAKSLFEDVLNGSIVRPRPTSKAATGRAGAAPQGGGEGQRAAGATRSVSVVEETGTGIMYFLELQQSDGKFTPVSRRRVFHAGERVRIQLMSNVSGRLAVLQSLNGSAPKKLFPKEGSGTRANVTAGVATTLPSAKGWKFDGNPGEIRLLVLVVAEDEARRGEENGAPAVPAREERSAAEMPRVEPQPQSPSRPQAPARRQADSSADAEDRAVRSQLEPMVDEEQRPMNGSKGLIDDEESADSGTPYAHYVVADRRRDPQIPKGILVFEIAIRQN